MGKARTRSASPLQGLTFDTGALIALERGDGRLIALLDQALSEGRKISVPAGVVGQAWRDGRRQVTLTRFFRAAEVNVVPLGERLAQACGELCGLTRTADVIDASVVLVARERGDIVVTGDLADLRRLDPGSTLVGV